MIGIDGHAVFVKPFCIPNLEKSTAWGWRKRMSITGYETWVTHFSQEIWQKSMH